MHIRNLRCLHYLSSLKPSKDGLVQIPKEMVPDVISTPQGWIQSHGYRARIDHSAPGVKEAIALAASLMLGAIDVERALSIRQPWAWAVASGRKRIENRTWQPRKALGSWIAIHAGLTVDKAAVPAVAAECGIDPTIHFGAIVGIARVDSVIMHGKSYESLEMPDRVWFNGPYGWFLKDAVEIDPISCRGYQSLWHLDPAIREQLNGVLRGVA